MLAILNDLGPNSFKLRLIIIKLLRLMSSREKKRRPERVRNAVTSQVNQSTDSPQEVVGNGREVIGHLSARLRDWSVTTTDQLAALTRYVTYIETSNSQLEARTDRSLDLAQVLLYKLLQRVISPSISSRLPPFLY